MMNIREVYLIGILASTSIYTYVHSYIQNIIEMFTLSDNSNQILTLNYLCTLVIDELGICFWIFLNEERQKGQYLW